MRVYFEEIGEPVIRGAIGQMPYGGFTAAQLEDELNSRGIKNSLRAADRILQREKRKGNLSFSDGKWRNMK